METKICSKCGLKFPKSNDFFYKSYKGVLRGPCKECVKKRVKAYKKRTNYASDRKWAKENKTYYKDYMNGLNDKIRKKLGIGYVGIHKFIRENKTKPKYCSICNEIKYLELHCFDHNYTRDLTKWIYVCKACHSELNTLTRTTY